MRWARTSKIALAGAFVLEGCSLIYGTSDLSGGSSPGSDHDAAIEAAALEPTDAEAGGAADSTVAADAGSDAAVLSTSCGSGVTQVVPLDVFDALPLGSELEPCNPDEVRASDGRGAGLDTNGATPGTLAGEMVTSCIGVRFADPLAFATARVRAVANACGVGCSGTTCGTGDDMMLFAGGDGGTVHLVGRPDITVAFADYRVTMTTTDRIVVVCRQPHGSLRDDVEVDSILGTCP